MGIESITNRVNPKRWEGYTPPTENEIKKLQSLQACQEIHRDTISSFDSPTAVRTPGAPTQMEKNLFRKDSLASMEGGISEVRKPTLGIHKLKTPEEYTNPTPQQKAAEQLAPVKTATKAGIFDQVKNFIYNIFGWSTSPIPAKEAQITERDCEAITKALEQMSLAINKLITKPSEDSKESRSDSNDREAQLLQLKQLKNEVEILKEVLTVIKEEVHSKELDAVLSTEELSKNNELYKELQTKRLGNLQEIEKKLKTSKLLNWVEMGAAGVGISCAIIGVALALSNPVTAGALLASTSIAQVLTALAGGVASSSSLGLAALGGTAALAQGSAAGTGAHYQYQSKTKLAQNEEIQDLLRKLNIQFDMGSERFSKSMKNTNDLYKSMALIPKSQADTIRYIASQIKTY